MFEVGPMEGNLWYINNKPRCLARQMCEELEYILTHLDSSNITEIDTSKTKIYEGGENEL